jgi:hypothetical protein
MKWDESQKLGGEQLIFLSSKKSPVPARTFLFVLRGGACAMEGFMLLTNNALAQEGQSTPQSTSNSSPIGLRWIFEIGLLMRML